MSKLCSVCQSPRIAQIFAKCNDCCAVVVAQEEYDGYVPSDMGVGGGDYVEFSYCLACGTIVGSFPLPPTDLEARRGVE